MSYECSDNNDVKNRPLYNGKIASNASGACRFTVTVINREFGCIDVFHSPKEGFDTVTIEGGYTAWKDKGNKKNEGSSIRNE